MNGTINEILPVLRSLGVNPNKLNPDKLERLMKLCNNITDLSQINQETTRQLIDTIGITANKQTKPKKSIRIGRNESCICESGLKYKKCCGK